MKSCPLNAGFFYFVYQKQAKTDPAPYHRAIKAVSGEIRQSAPKPYN
jgi:hypothetical protein